MKSTEASPPFSSAHSFAQLVITLLALSILIDLIAIAIAGYQVMLLTSALTAETDLTPNDDTPQIFGTLQLAAHLIAVGFFLSWFYRAHENLRALRIRRGRYASPWTILLFFVPILNLYYSYDIVKELWKQSSPDLGFSDAFLKQHALTLEYPSKTALVGAWWGFTIASIFAARTSLTIMSRSPGVSDQLTGTWMSIITDALGIVAIIALILIVKRIDAGQEEKHRRLTLEAATQKAK